MNNGAKDADFMPMWEKILVLCVLTFSFSSLYVVIFDSLGKKWIPDNPYNDTDSSISNVTLVHRKEWNAETPKIPPELLLLPVPYVIISHTAGLPCYKKSTCSKYTRFIQIFHIEGKGWRDIAYNFLVGGDGLVYEGRGWNAEGAHTSSYNPKSLGISFIGNFNDKNPTDDQVSAAKKLLEHGVSIGKIDKNYKLLGHRQCVKTESPGDKLYNIIKTWDHWSSTT